jgi:thiol-disulfide isomerase/thioredoxin
MVAYKPEELNKEPRVSKDVPVNFQEWKEVVDSKPLIVLYLWSNNCRPCLMIRDKFESMAKSLQNEDVVFYKDNIDLPTSFHKKSVEVVPTFFVVADGMEKDHPIHKSRYNGWSASIKESILFHAGQSERWQEKKKRAEESAKPPEIVCRNDVCYIVR